MWLKGWLLLNDGSTCVMKPIESDACSARKLETPQASASAGFGACRLFSKGPATTATIRQEAQFSSTANRQGESLS
jgi:hypothetical protein